MDSRNSIPSHIAIIMDGNGRWAKKLNKTRSFGHDQGVKTVIDIVEHSRQLDVRYLTLYAFSTENWKRPKIEVNFIMKLVIKYIDQELNHLVENGVRVNVLGDYKSLNEPTRRAIEKAIEKTKGNDDMVLNIGLNYGGRDEIIRATRKLALEVKEGKISVDDIDDRSFKSHLYTKDQPDPDLLIRTGSEQRLSNFLTYQSVYSELYFTDTLWPEFTRSDLNIAINTFQSRQRRYGGLNE